MTRPFVHQNSGDAKRGTSPSGPGGLIETTKRAIVLSLRKAFDNTEDQFLRRVSGNVEMEYPLEESKYPGVWIGFSFTKMQLASLDPEHYEEQPNGSKLHYSLGSFEGVVSLTILSLSSLERDRISDALVQTILFGRRHEVAATFYDDLENNDYVNISVQNGTVRPSGQNTTFGTPWGTEDTVYEDAYNFSIMGQFASRYEDYGLVNLREIRIVPIDVTQSGFSKPIEGLTPPSDAPDPGTWI